MKRPWSMLVAWVVAGSWATATLGQPPPAEPDRATLRQRLERRLQETNRIRERLEAAIQRLDEGASVEDVQRGLMLPGEPRRGEGSREGGPGGRRGEHPEGGPPAEGRPDPEADRRLVLGFLERYEFASLGRIRDLLRDRPEDARRLIARLAPRIRDILSERDEELRDLRIAEFRQAQDVMDAARRLGEAMGGRGDPTAAELDLRAALGRQFDLRAQVHQREVAVLEERLRRLRAELEEQTGQRDAYIERQVEQIRRFGREWAQRSRNAPPPEPPP